MRVSQPICKYQFQIGDELLLSLSSYGSMAQAFSWNQTTELPKPGRRVLPQDGLVFYNNVTDSQTYVFYDSSDSSSAIKVFTERTVNATWACESHAVISHGDGTWSEPTIVDSMLKPIVKDLGTCMLTSNSDSW